MKNGQLRGNQARAARNADLQAVIEWMRQQAQEQTFNQQNAIKVVTK